MLIIFWSEDHWSICHLHGRQFTPIYWKMGRISDVYPEKDGIIKVGDFNFYLKIKQVIKTQLQAHQSS